MSVELTAAVLSAVDGAIVCTDHDVVDWDGLVDRVPLIVDTRNALAGIAATRGNIVKA